MPAVLNVSVVGVFVGVLVGVSVGLGVAVLVLVGVGVGITVRVGDGVGLTFHASLPAPTNVRQSPQSSTATNGTVTEPLPACLTENATLAGARAMRH